MLLKPISNKHNIISRRHSFSYNVNLEEFTFIFSLDKPDCFNVEASYKFWAPWIGPNSRAHDLVYNTEYRKCHRTLEDEITQEVLNGHTYCEEDLLNMMNFAHVSIYCYTLIDKCTTLECWQNAVQEHYLGIRW